MFVRRLAQSTISRDFRAIAETDGCDDLQLFRFVDARFRLASTWRYVFTKKGDGGTNRAIALPIGTLIPGDEETRHFFVYL